MVLLVCSFGFMISYTVGICFSFNAYVSAVVFGLFSMAVHWINSYFKTKPPGSFFFIMIAAMASFMPFNLHTIPEKVGLIGLGSMFACTERVFHRVLGTFIGLGLCWVMLSISKTPLSICINIIVLQLIIEMLVVRHYALAVVFITP